MDIGTIYTDTIASGQDFQITGISVPADADIAVLIVHGYDTSAVGPQDDFVDESNFDGDSDDHFTHIVSAGDDNEPAVGMWKLEYGETGFPTRGATGLTLDISLAYNVRYGGGAIELFFLSGVDIGSAVIGTDYINNDGSGWLCNSLGSVGADDLAIIAATGYNSAIESTPSGSGQTEIAEGSESTMDYAAAYEFNEDQLSVDYSGSFMGGVAVAIKASVGGGGNAPTGALYGPLGGCLAGPI